MEIKFEADRVKINGPRIDGSFTVTFEVGEYQYDRVKEIPKLNGTMIFVEVKDNGNSRGEAEN